MSTVTSPEPVSDHPVAYFHPSHWTNQLLHRVPLDEATRHEKEQEVEHLKEEIKKELLANANKPLEQLVCLIDAIERLGLAYHFEKEIEEALQHVYESYHHQCEKDDDLYRVSTRFRILRQHGFYVPCDVFKKFMDDKGGFKSCILNDTRGMLSLYEASHVRIHEDRILDEAFGFTTTHLKSIVDTSSSPLAEQVGHALHQPIHKGFILLEAKHYVNFYEQDASHNKVLLKFAKLDFNLLQSLHQQELQNISEWWNDLYSKVPYARDRLVEGYFWVLGCYHEPEYSRARGILIKLFMIVEIFDDIFDAYGSYEVLELFVEAVHSWDYGYIAQLPEHFNSCYQVLLETLDEFEKELAKEGRSYGVHCYREQFYRGCQAWLREAKWCNRKYVPKYNEYMEVALVSIGQIQGVVGSFLGMGPIATKEDYEWVCRDPMPKLVHASLIILRLMNDVASTEFEQTTRNHVVSSVQCYMKETGISDEERVYQALEEQVEDAWKDLNQRMLRPYAIPKPLLDRILNLARAPDIFYKGRTDGYTVVNQTVKDKIAAVLFAPIPE